jgi:hypothetical protein
MDEIHIVLLNDGELDATSEHDVVLEACLYTEEVVTSHGATCRTDTGTKQTVLITVEVLLVENATIPVVVLPERITADLATDRVSLPAISNLTEHLYGIAIREFLLISYGGIEG